jgi:hypothetical protein
MLRLLVVVTLPAQAEVLELRAGNKPFTKSWQEYQERVIF